MLSLVDDLVAKHMADVLCDFCPIPDLPLRVGLFVHLFHNKFKKACIYLRPFRWLQG